MPDCSHCNRPLRMQKLDDGYFCSCGAGPFELVEVIKGADPQDVIRPKGED